MKREKKTSLKDLIDAGDPMANAIQDMNLHIHETLEGIEELMEKHELYQYVDKGNVPKDRMIDESDIGPEEVLFIGAYCATKSLHDNFHKIMEKNLGIDRDTNYRDHDDEPNVQVINDINELPKDVREALKKKLPKSIVKNLFKDEQ